MLRDERYLIGVRREAGDRPSLGDEVVLVIDEGVQFFDLRAIYIRGTVSAEGLPADDSGLRWLEVEPTKIVAWDFSEMRVAADGS